ncbi:MAG: hypothetical protein AB8F74_21940 [Saprospiraceae bacterium]
MKKLSTLLFFVLFVALSQSSIGQNLKKEITDSEINYLTGVFEEISQKDQQYRSYLQCGTLDDNIIATIDSIMNNVGIEEGFKYQKSLNLSLTEHVKDSLWNLQNQLDLQNHMTIRGVWAAYGYIPKELIEENNHVQVLLLLHPPKDWDVQKFHADYSTFLMTEVEAERMPAKTYAMFYDNILCKILRKPQLYGTNQQYDSAEGKVLPPIIDDLAMANKARKDIGLPTLEEGEYRLAK